MALGMMAMKPEKKRVTLTLTLPCYQKIKALAQENQYSIPGYIRQVLRLHLRELGQKDEQ